MSACGKPEDQIAALKETLEAVKKSADAPPLMAAILVLAMKVDGIERQLDQIRQALAARPLS
ncbi:MAG: hypothetical protein JSU63_17740 [Phycisphaerales bacterium]|nr:MAG: hypothetical protein JSU63_17740 [Phycisphaerales bacterium]